MGDSNEFGQLLHRLRRAHDLTQVALGRAAFCSRDTIKKLEGGQRRPSRQLAAQLADVLELTGDERRTFLRTARPEAEADDNTGAPTPASVPPDIRPLPRPLTPFIGRAHELNTLLTRLGDPATRLLTLVAPGGMGKTRLALAVAEQLQAADAFAQGVAFVSLAPLSESAHLASAIADALGLPQLTDGTRPPRTQVLDYLQEKRLLLILDNCEYLLAGVIELVQGILIAAPQVTLLTTSRERLGLRIEQLLPLDGLVTEAEGSPSSPRRRALYSPPLCSTPPPARRWRRSAPRWTGCRWRLSWPPPGPTPSVWRSAAAWETSN